VTFWSFMGPSNVGWWAAGCVGIDCCAVVVLIVLVYGQCCCHVGCLLPIAGGVLIVLVLVHCCCHVGCLLPIAGGDRVKKQGEKNPGKISIPVGEANADEKGC
jgi:hypothetical protein